MTDPLLDETSVIPYLRGRGILNDSQAQARFLGGGVSNVVVAVTQGSTRLVLKQSLPRLRVEAEWRAPVDRVITEGTAIVLASRILGTGPRLRDSDEERFTITMDRADDTWTDWKSQIFSDNVAVETAAEVGRQLALLHSQTLGGAILDERFFRTGPLDVLRIEPYYLATAARAPAQAKRIGELAEQVRERRVCLVHGDLSPKNILVGIEPDQVWLLDWEVAHFGNPEFDLAFMVTHLLMKSIYLPAHRAALDQARQEFASSYEGGMGDLRPDWNRVLDQVGCLLMARVLGKSPVEYLDPAAQSKVLELGRILVERRGTEPSDLAALRERILQ